MGTFEIVVDHPRCMLRMTLCGFFQPEDVMRFAERKRAAHEDLRCPPNRHVTLADVSQCKIQPQLVVGAFSALLADPRYRGRRTAFVTGSSLAIMQVRRLIGGEPDVRFFADAGEAELWLLSDPVEAEPVPFD